MTNFQHDTWIKNIWIKNGIRCCGAISIFGVTMAVITNIIGSILVQDHNPVADTISQLAITELAWIQDVGLDSLAVGAITCAIGMLLVCNVRMLITRRLVIAIGLLVLVGIDIIIIAEHNKYAGRPDVVGASIHLYCVIMLGILLAAVFWLMQPYFDNSTYIMGRTLSTYNKACFWSWVISAPIFFIIPNSVDGLYERLIAIIPLGWLTIMGWHLLTVTHPTNEAE